MSLKDTIALISSTFNDMHFESNHIIKEAFLKLTEYKILQFFIDLKFASTEKEIPQNKIIKTCLNTNHKFISFLEQHYGLISDCYRNINCHAKKRYNPIDAEEMPVTKIKIENNLLNHICMQLKENFVSLPNGHSLFFSRNPSYIDELLSSQLIYANNSEIKNDQIKLSDAEVDKNKSKCKDNAQIKGMKIESHEPKINRFPTASSQNWNTKILIPQHHPCKTDGENLKLTNFKLMTGRFLKDVLIDQFKEEIAPKFLENMTFNAKRHLKKILNRKGISYLINRETLIPRVKYAQIIKSNIEHSEICLASAGPCYEKTLVLSRSCTDSYDAYPNEKSCKQFFLTSDLMNEISSIWKSIEEFNPKNVTELKLNKPQILQASENQSIFSIFDAANKMLDGVKGFDEIQGNLKLIMTLKEDKNNELFNPNLQNIIAKFKIQKPYDDSKKELMKKYFKDYLKSMNENQIKKNCSFEYFKKPLFLKILIRELRAYNSSAIN